MWNRTSLIQFSKSILIPCLLFTALIFNGHQLTAQRTSGDVGLGFQVGDPTGVSLKLYKPTTSVDLLAAWDFDHYLFFAAHIVYDKHLNDEQTIHFIYGPGAFISLHGSGHGHGHHHHGFGLIHNNSHGDQHFDGELGLGFSGIFGIDFLIDRFEIFLQVSPRLALVKSTHFDLGGGIGARYYF